MNTEEIIKEAINRGFTYDQNTGCVYGSKGNPIYRSHKNGYVYPSIKIGGKKYGFLGHQFAWFITYGKMPDNCIDHINGITNDNRITNLRDVTQQKNCFNKSKAKGYYWNKREQKYQSGIMVDGKQKNLGCFNTESEARQAYLDAKKIYHKI